MTKKNFQRKSLSAEKKRVETIPTQKSITVKSHTTDTLLKKSKRHKFLTKKFMAKCLKAETFRLKSFYDNWFDIKQYCRKD